MRLLLTTFFLVEFGMAVWSYYDDSALVDIDALASSSWYIFLRLHSLLRIPIKGSPLQHASATRQGTSGKRKLFAPASSNPFLGEMVQVGQLPCCGHPTTSRKESTKNLVAEIKQSRRLPPNLAASVHGKANEGSNI